MPVQINTYFGYGVLVDIQAAGIEVVPWEQVPDTIAAPDDEFLSYFPRYDAWLRCEVCVDGCEAFVGVVIDEEDAPITAAEVHFPLESWTAVAVLARIVADYGLEPPRWQSNAYIL